MQPDYLHAENSTTQADWIATRIESVPGTNHLGRIGILTRTHKRSEAVSRALTQLGIAHLTVEQFDFFRRNRYSSQQPRLLCLLTAHCFPMPASACS
jgi:superfamily I DNA/RNA helicase